MKENIEEDLKIVEKLIKTMEQDKNTFKDEQAKEIYAFFITALENILSDYKRVLKENEDWQRAYQEEKDKQFDLLRENQKLQKENEELLEIRISAGAHNRIIELEKENEELKADNYELNNIINDLLDSIPTQKVKDKIEKIEKAYKESKDEYGETPYYYPNYTIDILQDLLEEKGE